MRTRLPARSVPALAASFALLALLGAPRAARADDPPPPEYSAAQRALLQYAAGAAVSLVAVPTSVGAGTLFGRASSDLVGAALPAAITFLAVPTFGVTLAEVHVGNTLAPGSARVSPAIFAALGVDLGALALGALGGVSARDPLGLTLFTVATSAVLPGVVALTLHATQPRALRDARPRAATAAAMTRPRRAVHSHGGSVGPLDAPAYALAPAARDEGASGAVAATVFVPVFRGTF